jgi:hypothetical protein
LKSDAAVGGVMQNEEENDPKSYKKERAGTVKRSQHDALVVLD